MINPTINDLKSSRSIMESLIPDLAKGKTSGLSIPGMEGDSWSLFKDKKGFWRVKRMSGDENFTCFDLLMQRDNISFKEACELLTGKQITNHKEINKMSTKNKKEIETIDLSAWLIQHALSKEELEGFGCKVTEEKIAFPVQTNEGIKYHSRFFNSNKKYKADAGLEANKYYFSITPLKHRKLIIAAGEADTINLHKALGNEYDCVGVFGEKIIPTELLQIAPNYSEIFILFDNDKAGYEGAFRLAEAIHKESKNTQIFASTKASWTAWQEVNDVSELASKQGLNELNKLLNELEEYCGEDEDLIEIESIFQANGETIDPERVFPTPLGRVVKQTALEMNKPVEFLINNVLAVCASLIGKSYKLKINSKWSMPSILWMCNVSLKPSSGKTPMFNLAIDGLRKRQEPEILAYRKALKDYEEQLQNHKDLTPAERKEFTKPQSPNGPMRWYVDDFTIESLREVVRLNEEIISILIAKDEGAALFGMLNQYKAGKGTDLEKLLEFWNGLQSIIDRVGGKEPFLYQCLTSILININLRVLARVIDKDEQGLTARFLFANPSNPQYKDLEDENNETSLIAITLEKLYSSIEALTNQETMNVRLSAAAKSIFKQVKRKIADLIEESPSYTYGAWLGKFDDHFGRLMLVLHVIGAALNNHPVATEISEETALRALHLVTYYKAIAFRLLSLEGVSKQADSLINLGKRKGWVVSVNDCVKAKICQNKEGATKLFKEMAKQGWGRVEMFQVTKPGVRFIFEHNKKGE